MAKSVERNDGERISSLSGDSSLCTVSIREYYGSTMTSNPEDQEKLLGDSLCCAQDCCCVS